jgi:hypothetical protein
MNTENINKEKQTKALSQDAVSGSFNVCCLTSYTDNSPKYIHIGVRVWKCSSKRMGLILN